MNTLSVYLYVVGFVATLGLFNCIDMVANGRKGVPKWILVIFSVLWPVTVPFAVLFGLSSTVIRQIKSWRQK